MISLSPLDDSADGSRAVDGFGSLVVAGFVDGKRLRLTPRLLIASGEALRTQDASESSAILR